MVVSIQSNNIKIIVCQSIRWIPFTSINDDKISSRYKQNRIDLKHMHALTLKL